MSLRFHWSLSQVGDKFRRANATADMKGLFSLETQIQFCRAAELCGIDSLLMAFGFTRPDPMTLAAALGMHTDRIKFMVACRPGVMSPTVFVQQINTVSALTNGRVHINIVTGHSPHELRYYGDFLEHDQRYERTDEFLEVCRAFWARNGDVNFRGTYYEIENGKVNTPFVSAERSSPEIFLGGNSEQAEQLAIKHANCLWRFADTPENLSRVVPRITAQGTEVGLLVSILARPTREAAVRDAYAMVQSLTAKQPQAFGKQFAQKTDSVAYRSTLELAEKIRIRLADALALDWRDSLSRIAGHRTGRRAGRNIFCIDGIQAGGNFAVPVHGLAGPGRDDLFRTGGPAPGAGKRAGIGTGSTGSRVKRSLWQ